MLSGVRRELAIPTNGHESSQSPSNDDDYSLRRLAIIRCFRKSADVVEFHSGRSHRYPWAIASFSTEIPSVDPTFAMR
jgi:hypothetical protein